MILVLKSLVLISSVSEKISNSFKFKHIILCIYIVPCVNGICIRYVWVFYDLVVLIQCPVCLQYFNNDNLQTACELQFRYKTVTNHFLISHIFFLIIMVDCYKAKSLQRNNKKVINQELVKDESILNNNTELKNLSCGVGVDNAMPHILNANSNSHQTKCPSENKEQLCDDKPAVKQVWQRRDSFSSCSSDSAIYCGSRHTQTNSGAPEMPNVLSSSIDSKRNRHSSGSSVLSNTSDVSNKESYTTSVTDALNYLAPPSSCSNSERTFSEVSKNFTVVSEINSQSTISYTPIKNSNETKVKTVLQQKTVSYSCNTIKESHPLHESPHNLRRNIRKKTCCNCDCSSQRTTVIVRRFTQIQHATTAKHCSKIRKALHNNNNSTQKRKVPADVEVDSSPKSLPACRKRRSEVDKLYDALHEIKWAKHFSPDNILSQIDFRRAASVSVYSKNIDSPSKSCKTPLKSSIHNKHSKCQHEMVDKKRFSERRLLQNVNNGKKNMHVITYEKNNCRDSKRRNCTSDYSRKNNLILKDTSDVCIKNHGNSVQIKHDSRNMNQKTQNSQSSSEILKSPDKNESGIKNSVRYKFTVTKGFQKRAKQNRIQHVKHPSFHSRILRKRMEQTVKNDPDKFRSMNDDRSVINVSSVDTATSTETSSQPVVKESSACLLPSERYMNKEPLVLPDLQCLNNTNQKRMQNQQMKLRSAGSLSSSDLSVIAGEKERSVPSNSLCSNIPVNDLKTVNIIQEEHTILDSSEMQKHSSDSLKTSISIKIDSEENEDGSEVCELSFLNKNQSAGSDFALPSENLLPNSCLASLGDINTIEEKVIIRGEENCIHSDDVNETETLNNNYLIEDKVVILNESNISDKASVLKDENLVNDETFTNNDCNHNTALSESSFSDDQKMLCQSSSSTDEEIPVLSKNLSCDEHSSEDAPPVLEPSIFPEIKYDDGMPLMFDTGLNEVEIVVQSTDPTSPEATDSVYSSHLSDVSETESCDSHKLENSNKGSYCHQCAEKTNCPRFHSMPCDQRRRKFFPQSNSQITRKRILRRYLHNNSKTVKLKLNSQNGACIPMEASSRNSMFQESSSVGELSCDTRTAATNVLESKTVTSDLQSIQTVSNCPRLSVESQKGIFRSSYRRLRASKRSNNTSVTHFTAEKQVTRSSFNTLQVGGSQNSCATETSYSQTHLMQYEEEECRKQEDTIHGSGSGLFSKRILPIEDVKKPKVDEDILRMSFSFTFHYKGLTINKNDSYTQIVLKPTRGQHIFLTVEALTELKDTLNSAGNDSKCQVVIINGTGNTFCSGLDLRPLIGPRKKAACKEMAVAVKEFVEALAAFHKPLVSVVNGLAMGFGVTLLTYSDVVLASDTAIFYMPYTQLGYMPEGAATLMLPHVVGSTLAMDMLLRGRKLTAQQALDYGLVSEVLKANCLPQELVSRVRVLAESPISAMETTKAMLRMHLLQKLNLTLENEVVMLPKQWLSQSCQSTLKEAFENRLLES